MHPHLHTNRNAPTHKRTELPVVQRQAPAVAAHFEQRGCNELTRPLAQHGEAVCGPPVAPLLSLSLSLLLLLRRWPRLAAAVWWRLEQGVELGKELAPHAGEEPEELAHLFYGDRGDGERELCASGRVRCQSEIP